MSKKCLLLNKLCQNCLHIFYTISKDQREKKKEKNTKTNHTFRQKKQQTTEKKKKPERGEGGKKTSPGIFVFLKKSEHRLGWHQNKKRGQCPRFWGISDPPLPPPKRGHFLFFFPLFFAGFWVTGCKFVTQNTVFWHFRNPSRKWWGQSRKLDNFLTT